MHKSRRTWACVLYETANTVVYVQELDSGKDGFQWSCIDHSEALHAITGLTGDQET